MLHLLHGGQLAFGVLSAMAGLGGRIGGLIADRAISGLGRRTTAVTGLALSITSNLVMGTVILVEAAAVAGVLFGIGIGLSNVLFVAMRQRLVPPGILGRVVSVHRFLAWGALPLGALLGGVLAQAFGLRVPYLVAAGLVAVAALGFGRSLLAIPEPPQPVGGR